MAFVITATSKPVYDRGGFDDYWSALDWVNWHKAMKTSFGQQQANNILIDAFHNPPSSGFWSILGPLEMFAHTNYRSTDQGFIKYAKDNGFYNDLFPGLSGLIGKTASLGYNTADTALNAGNVVVDTSGNVVDSAGDAATDAAKSAENLAILLKYGLPILILLALYLGYKFFLQTKFAKSL